MKIKHLTMTGPNAGNTYCGAARAPSDSCAHLPYATVAKLIEFVMGKIECKECQQIFIDSYLQDYERKTYADLINQ